MHRFHLPRPLLASPVVAIVAQLLLTAVAAANTIGGGFPALQK
jgi:hypothetical protein